MGLVRAALSGLAQRPVRVLASTNRRALGDAFVVPDNARLVEWASYAQTMPHCDVVVCHGGYGTLLDAVDAAVPLIVVPFGADQHINGASVERLGIGRVIDEDALTADVLRSEVHALLDDPEWQSNITELRDAWHALPGPAAAAALVEQIGRSIDQ